MCKEGWVLWIRAGWGCVRVEGTVWNTLKGDGREKRGGEAKILKNKGQAGSRDGCIKKEGGAGTPLRNYDVYIYIVSGK